MTTSTLAKIPFMQSPTTNKNKKTKKEKITKMSAKKRKHTAAYLQEKTVPFEKRVELKKVIPITEKQQDAFVAYEEGQNLLLHGCAGTGKTYIALYLALRELFSGKSDFKKIVVVRSVVPARDMGFLPGNTEEKTEVYETPYSQAINDLLGRGDAYEILTSPEKKVIEFVTTSFLRGTTFRDTIIIADEFQNMTAHEFSTIMTRVGENCRLIVAGDCEQSDFFDDGHNKSIVESLHLLQKIDSVTAVEFGLEDIVRSGFAKAWIEAKWNNAKD